jgi:hypothetical protein
MFNARAGIRRHDARQVPGISEEKEDLLVWIGNPLHEFKPIRHAFSLRSLVIHRNFLSASEIKGEQTGKEPIV